MKESYIKRTRRTRNFTHLGNEIFSSNLSPEALGILCYILHLPDDWILRKKQLMSHFKIGRDKLDRVFKELRTTGYIAEVIKVRGAGGKFDGVNYIVYDSPIDNTTGKPLTGNQYTGKPLTDKPYNGKTTPTKDYHNKELTLPITNSPRTNVTKGSAEWKMLSDAEKSEIDPLWFFNE